MTFPFDDKAKVIATTVGAFQEKDRIVFCPQCKYSTITRLYGAKCGKCDNFLLTYIDELVK